MTARRADDPVWQEKAHARAENWRDMDAERVLCPVCDGRGEVPTGRREWETGVYESVDCAFCNSVGEVDARLVDGSRDYTPELRYPAGGWI